MSDSEGAAVSRYDCGVDADAEVTCDSCPDPDGCIDRAESRKGAAVSAGRDEEIEAVIRHELRPWVRPDVIEQAVHNVRLALDVVRAERAGDVGRSEIEAVARALMKRWIDQANAERYIGGPNTSPMVEPEEYYIDDPPEGMLEQARLDAIAALDAVQAERAGDELAEARASQRYWYDRAERAEAKENQTRRELAEARASLERAQRRQRTYDEIFSEGNIRMQNLRQERGEAVARAERAEAELRKEREALTEIRSWCIDGANAIEPRNVLGQIVAAVDRALEATDAGS